MTPPAGRRRRTLKGTATQDGGTSQRARCSRLYDHRLHGRLYENLWPRRPGRHCDGRGDRLAAAVVTARRSPVPGHLRRPHGGTPTCKASTPTRTKRTHRSNGLTSSRGATAETFSAGRSRPAGGKNVKLRRKQIAGGIGGAETGAGPTHWYEHLQGNGSRPCAPL